MSSTIHGYRKVNEMDNLHQFKAVLQETIQYCLQPKEKTSLTKTFRTAELMPFPFSQPDLAPWPFLTGNYPQVIENVIRARRKRLSHFLPSHESVDLKGGKLLYYIPESQIADGASEVASAGFIDLYDTPPWDTWIAYITTQSREDFFSGRETFASTYAISCLISYVPQAYLSFVQAGVEVNCIESFRWADDFDCEFTQKLIDEGIIQRT